VLFGDSLTGFAQSNGSPDSPVAKSKSTYGSSAVAQ
jgi:hypothetical protein